MTGPDHYREAERLLTVVDGLPVGALHDGLGALTVAQAQVHATLALAAATVEQTASRGPGDVGHDWWEAIS